MAQRTSLKTPRITVMKGIRLTPSEAALITRLLPQFPECASEAELLRMATLTGLYMLAAQATGTPAYGGYRPDELAALLKYRVLGAIDFLFEHDAFPALYRTQSSSAPAVESEPQAPAPPAPTVQMAAAAAELSDLGTDFLE